MLDKQLVERLGVEARERGVPMGRIGECHGNDGGMRDRRVMNPLLGLLRPWMDAEKIDPF